MTCFNTIKHRSINKKENIMRPLITQEEIDMLKQDIDMLAEQNLVGIEISEALTLLEMRRQTSKLELIKRALSNKE